MFKKIKKLFSGKKASNGRNEPYVKITGILQEADGRIRLELDWDDKFITHLKSNGYTGVDDTAIIQRYIAELTANITSEMKGDNSDYE